MIYYYQTLYREDFTQKSQITSLKKRISFHFLMTVV